MTRIAGRQMTVRIDEHSVDPTTRICCARPRPAGSRAQDVQPALRWFLLHLVAQGLTLAEAADTLDAATQAEAEALARLGVA